MHDHETALLEGGVYICWMRSLRIQLQGNSPIFAILSVSGQNQGGAFYTVVGKQKHDVQKTNVTWLLKRPIFMKTFSLYDGRC